jgi:septal ring factor EnvC (AmiA/AmiB activator)
MDSDGTTRDLIIRLDERVKSLHNMFDTSFKEIAREMGEIKTEVRETDASIRREFKNNLADVNGRLSVVERDIGKLKTEDAKHTGNREIYSWIVALICMIVAIIAIFI